MKITPTHIAALAGLSAAAFATYYLSKHGVSGLAKKAGEAAVNTASDAAAGLVIGIGKGFGIPETNLTECQKAFYEGRTWDASFACPAMDFIKGTFGTRPTPPIDYTVLDANDARLKAAQGLNGADCSCGHSWTPEAWIGLAALGASVLIHAQNRRKHRGR